MPWVCVIPNQKRPTDARREFGCLFREITSAGSAGEDQLSQLLRHDDEGVRLWAASHLINRPNYHSSEVLQSIKDPDTVIALVAELVLDKWKRGDITY